MALKTALVVDDSKLARITLQRLLEKHDLAVHSAESGIQALDILKSLSPDVIFMDHLMPELDGFETTRKIKSDARLCHIPVIMCSGKEGVDNYEEQAIAIGASGILSKPPQPDKLQEALVTAEKSRTVHSTVAVQAPSSSAPATSTAIDLSSELAALLRRIELVENRPIEIPSFDGFQQQLQDNTRRVVAVDTHCADLARQIGSLNEECGALEGQVGALGARLADLAHVPAAIEQLRNEWQVDLDDRIRDVAAALVSEKAPAPVPVPVLDEEALGARVARDVENTLTPILEAELRVLEERMTHALDEAVSESRKDLDASLADRLAAVSRTTEEAADTALTALSPALEQTIADLALRTATAAIDTRLDDVEARLQSGSQVALQQIRAELSEVLERQPATAAVDPAPPQADGEALAQLVEAAVRAHM